MSLKILERFKTLDEHDFEILYAIEHIMTFQSVVKLEEIAKSTDFSMKYVNKRIGLLDKAGILTAHRVEDQYQNIILNFMGFDALAIKDVVEKNILDGIGLSIGIGKESNVFTGISTDQTKYALKFHKIGKTKFKATKRRRDYFANSNYTSKFYESQ